MYLSRLPSVVLSAALGAAVPCAAQAAADVHPALPSCHACHGLAGISERGSVPNLAGQKAPYLVAQLEAFRRGDRKHDVMAAIAAQLGGQDMRLLAEHWSRLPLAASAPAGEGAVPVASRMAWPAGFPQGFERYASAVAGDALTQRWANRAALDAAAQGQALPEGAVIVVSHHRLEAQPGGGSAPGPALSYDTMERRAGWGAAVPTLLRNGDWDYAQFDARQQRRSALNQAACLACHQPLAARSHVFTLHELAAHARAAAGSR
jgi:cytochrome c553